MAGHTPTTPIRVPRSMWAAYGRVCARLGRDRTEDLLAHMRKMIEAIGDEQDRADLADAEAELAERRARRGGRPRTAKVVEPADASSGRREADTEAN